MRLTLDDILQQIGGYIEQDASTPTGTDLTLRTNYINRTLGEWANSYDWDELILRHNFTVSSHSQVSLSLPSNFRKPMSALYNYVSTSNVPDQYEIIPRDEAFMRIRTDLRIS